MAAAGDLDVNAVIDKLLDVRGARPGKQVNLTENEIRSLCIRCVRVLAMRRRWAAAPAARVAGLRRRSGARATLSRFPAVADGPRAVLHFSRRAVRGRQFARTLPPA